MSKGMVAALVGTLLALVATVILVPVRRWRRLDPSHPAFAEAAETYRAHVVAMRAEGVDPSRLDSYERAARGEWYSHEDGARLRFTPIWNRMRYQQGAQHIEDRVVWATLVLEQSLMVLIGGGLVTWLVRRDRRRRAEAAA